MKHFSHAHPLNLTPIESLACLMPPSCSCCKRRVESWAYTCHYCKFFLHKECSNLPQLVNHKFHPIHNLALLSNDKDAYECAACGLTGEGFSYHCRPCSLNLHPACSVMPTDLFSHSHHHHLSLTFRSPYPTQTFSCDVCHTIGSKWLYRCGVCEFDAHLNCAKEAPATQPRAHGGSPALHSNPAMISPANVAIVQVPMTGPANGGEPWHRRMVPMTGYSMAPENGGYGVGYAANSQVRPVASHGNPASINGSATHPSFNAQTGIQRAAFPAQYAVPQGFNGNQGVHQQRDGESFSSQLLLSVISGAAQGLVGSMLNL